MKNEESARAYLQSLGIPMSSQAQSQLLGQEFKAGGHFGIELSSMNNLKVIEKTLKLAKLYDIKIHRMIECRGMMRLPKNEIREMGELCQQERIGLILSIGPRATNDIGGFVHSSNGKRMGYRIRGADNVLYAIDEVFKAIELGIRGFLIYDEGLLYILNNMRANKMIPVNVTFKFSVHGGCANPFSAKLLELHGADSINVVPDLEIRMLESFRHVIKAPLDIFSDTAKEAGGLIRTYDIPEIVRLTSPVYLKCGPISQQFQNHLPSDSELEERVRQTKCVLERIENYLPEAKMVSYHDVTISLPNSNLTDLGKKRYRSDVSSLNS